MPKRIRLDLLPKTPGGRNIRPDAEINAEEVEFDEVVTIKTSMLRKCIPGNPWFEGDACDPEEDHAEPKFVARKSMDLRKIRSIENKVAALVSSPMIDARPRGQDISPDANDICNVMKQHDAITPLRVTDKKDLMRSTSRRLSRNLMQQFNPIASANHSRRKTFHTSEALTNAMSPRGRASVSPSLLSSENKENGPPDPNAFSPDPPTIDDKTTSSIEPQNPESLVAAGAFRVLCQMEISRIKILCEDWKAVLNEEAVSLPKLAADSIRATVGKGDLILKNKLPFFLKLVEISERDSSENDKGSPSADLNDLAGYWDLVANEIALVDAAFDRLCKWRDQWNWDVAKCPITPPRSVVVAAQRSRRTTNNTPKRVATTERPRIMKRNTPGRKVSVEDLDSEVTGTLIQTIQKSAKKSKPQTKSKFSEFLKAKKTALSSKPSSVEPAVAIFTPSTKGGTTIQQTHTPCGQENNSVPKETISATPELTPNFRANDSFAVPKHRALRSGSQRSVQSTSKIPILKNKSIASVGGVPPTLDIGKYRIASTPVAAKRIPACPHFGSALHTPHSGDESLENYSAESRPGTPRPPFKRKSEVPLSSYAERETLNALCSSSSEIMSSSRSRSRQGKKTNIICTTVDTHPCRP